MNRRFMMALLAIGAVGGFASGFRSMGRHCHWREQQRAAQVQQMAQACTEAARAENARHGFAQQQGQQQAPTVIVVPAYAPTPR